MTDLKKILICSDLDRTIIPNGFQEESTSARPVFRQFTKRAPIHLAYVSGRNKQLILEAIEEFGLPMPDYAIGDVGTTLYHIKNDNWRLSEEWGDRIGQDWIGLNWEGLAEYFEDMQAIRLQEFEKQSQYKLSFYTDQHVDYRHLAENIRTLLVQKGVRANIIWSIDEISTKGLLDIIPARANKLKAIQFLMQQEQFSEDRTVFAGDSGNDLDVLTSGLQAILVKNASDDVRKEASQVLSKKRLIHCLYLPKGNFAGMNGNYAAGVMEGLVHFIPESGEMIACALKKIKSAF